MNERRLVAYFSMEIALAADIPTYSGGLGVLAGDAIRAAADRKVPLLAVTLVHRKGVTGWAIGERCDPIKTDDDRSACDAASLYAKLEQVVIPLFYHDGNRFIDVMRHAIALNGSFFHTQRMILQYVVKAYFR